MEFPKKDFQIGSEDTNKVLFVGQRVCWKTDGSKSDIQVNQARCVADLGEIDFDKKLLDIRGKEIVDIKNADIKLQLTYI